MLIPREGSLLLAACGSLRIACESIVVNVAWNLIFGINHGDRGANQSSYSAASSCSRRVAVARHEEQLHLLVLEGRWKLVILFHLFGGHERRFSELRGSPLRTIDRGSS